MSLKVPILHGGRRFGRVWSYRGTYVETFFFHVWFVPLIPIGGVISKATEVEGLDERRATNVHMISALAGYLRVWPLVGCLAVLASWWGAWSWYAKPDGGIAFVVGALVAMGVSYALGASVPAEHKLAMDAWLDEGTAPDA